MKIKFFTGLFLLIVLVFTLPKSMGAHEGTYPHTHYPAISAEYNSQIIYDEFFRSKGTMTEAAIQQFLVDKGSALATYRVPSDGSVPTTIGWDFTVEAKNWSAAKVIYESAQWYDINPQVLLATLNKESSLVTSGTLDNLRAAMGYACPETNACNPFYYGFARQMDGAAYQFMHNFNGSESLNSNMVGIYYRGNTITLDGKSTYIGNSATASLYRYTPHRPDSAQYYDSWGNIVTSHYYGNYNFISFYYNWFNPAPLIRDSVTMNTIVSPYKTPAIGQTVDYTVTFTSSFSSNITLDAVGIAGRLNDFYVGANRDFGWQGSVVLEPNIPKQLSFSTTIKDTGTIYAWPVIYSRGQYIHYNNWGVALNTHQPNLTLSTPLTMTPSSPIVGQRVTFSATIKNNEPNPIKYDAVGIPIRFYSSYNNDVGWIGPGIIAANGTQTVSGSLNLSQPGPYTAWVLYYFNGSGKTLSSVLSYTATNLTPSFTMNYEVLPNTNPAKGEDVTVTYNLKNNRSVGITLPAVGLVGRTLSPYNGPNKDFGWVGPISFSANEQRSFSFSATITELNNYYVWPAFFYGGAYTHYGTWGFMLVPHQPNLTLSTPLTMTPSSPIVGQRVTFSATIKNNEPNPIKYDAVGIPIRFYSSYNNDVGWIGPGIIAANGTQTVSGSLNLSQPGPYTAWVSWVLRGGFTTLGNVFSINAVN